MNLKYLLFSAILASSLFADMGVRDMLISHKWKPITIDENTTNIKATYISTHIVKGAVKWCKEVGGSNLYALKDGKEIAYFKENGEESDEAAFSFTNMFKAVGGNFVFDGASSYPWSCRNTEKEIFKLDRKVADTSDGIGGKNYIFYMTFKHTPEAPTKFLPEQKKSTERKGELVTKSIDEQDYKTYTVQEVVYADKNDPKTAIAQKTADFKAPFMKQIGQIQYVGTYNGIDSSKCDLIAVLEKIDNQKTVTTHNYRICQNKVITLGTTFPTNTSYPALENAIKSTAKICQQSGSAMSEVDNLTLSCKAIRDKDNCAVEISVLNQSKQLVDKRVLSGCK